MSTTTPGGDSSTEADNSSSINNISSLLAERGTTVTSTGQLMDDFDESSIEALNWSEADEEELQLQAQKKSTKSKSPVVKTIEATTIEGELAAAAANLDQSTISSDSLTTVRMLSSSLLQSIDDDKSEAGVKQAKNAVIENWASEVKEAADRGEMEIEAEDEEESEEDKDGTVEEGDDAAVIKETMGIRKRKQKKVVPISGEEDKMMTGSVLSSLTTESGFDPLSNEPVLDEGPIWNKGPKRYRFQENRRINQKLTWCVLITVVLALGLGLGNLVAYNECETEYKQQQQQLKSSDASTANPPKQSIPAPEVTQKKVDLPSGATDVPPQHSTSNNNQLKKELPDLADDSHDSTAENEKPIHTKPDIESDREQYELQMEALTKIVKTLDHLQRKIDNFQNHTRRLGGVVVMNEPGEEKPADEEDENDDDFMMHKTTTANPLMDAMWDKDDNNNIENHDEVVEVENPAESLDKGNHDEYGNENFVLGLIDAIEETVNYLRGQDEIKHLDRLEERDAMNGMEQSEKLFRLLLSQLFSKVPPNTPQDIHASLTMQASIIIYKRSLQEFIKSERDELRDKKILGLAEDRQPEDYSAEEKAEVLAKYTKFMKEYPTQHELEVEMERLKFVKNDDDLLVADLQDDDAGIDDFFLHRRNYPSQAEEENDDGMAEWMKQEEKIEKMFQDHNDAELAAEESKSNGMLKTPSSDLPTTIPENEPAAAPQDSVTPPTEEIPLERKIWNKRLLKKAKRSKKSPEQESEEFGSGGGNGRKKKRHTKKDEKSSNNNGGGDKKSKKEEKQEKKKQRRQQQQQQNGKPSNKQGNSFKGYDLNNNWSVEQQDGDDDDDDHKRRKYHSKSGEDYSNNYPTNKRGQAQEDSNWLLERTKVRESFRNKDSGAVPSSGGKNHNWQFDRDSVRQRGRSSSNNKKSENGDKKKTNSY